MRPSARDEDPDLPPFEEVVARLGPIGSLEDREDAAQEGFVEYLEAVEGGKTVANATANIVRKAQSERSKSFRKWGKRVVSSDGLAASEVSQFKRASSSPLEQLELEITVARALTAVRTCTRSQRAAFRARVLDGMSEAEACARLGCPRSTLKARVRSVTRAMLACVEDDPRFRAEVIDLMNACLAGTASAEDRDAVRLLIKTDPVFARRYQELAASYGAARDRTPRLLAVAPLAVVGWLLVRKPAAAAAKVGAASGGAKAATAVAVGALGVGVATGAIPVPDAGPVVSPRALSLGPAAARVDRFARDQERTMDRLVLARRRAERTRERRAARRLANAAESVPMPEVATPVQPAAAVPVAPPVQAPPSVAPPTLPSSPAPPEAAPDPAPAAPPAPSPCEFGIEC